MSQIRELLHTIRGLCARAVVRSTDDGGETQKASARIFAGVDRTDIEVVQPFGIASRPRPGGVMVVLAVGGDQGDLVGLPVADPADRMGGLEEGEVAIYAADGSRIHISAEGVISVKAQTSVVAEVEGAKVEMTADTIKSTLGESSQTITADEIVNEVGGTKCTQSASGWEFEGGAIKHDGKSIDASHIHGGITPGPANTDVPAN